MNPETSSDAPETDRASGSAGALPKTRDGFVAITGLSRTLTGGTGELDSMSGKVRWQGHPGRKPAVLNVFATQNERRQQRRGAHVKSDRGCVEDEFAPGKFQLYELLIFLNESMIGG